MALARGGGGGAGVRTTHSSLEAWTEPALGGSTDFMDGLIYVDHGLCISGARVA